MTIAKMGSTQEQILAAAAAMFAQFGFRGISTREIARAAAVNEITVYRYFPTKHDLFIATLESEFQNLHVHPELVAQLATASDLRSTLQGMLVLIRDMLARLLQFSALEFGNELVPLYRKYLGSMIELSTHCIKRCMDAGELRSHDPRILILALAAAVINIPTFYPAIWGDNLPLRANEGLAAFYADLWRIALGQ